MGSGTSQNKVLIQSQNKIFLDEGVGIENSALSRRWTTKLSMFRNFDAMKASEHSRQGTHVRRQSDHKDSGIYSNGDEEISQSSQSVESEKIINPTNYKKITTFQSVSDDSDIDDRQASNVDFQRKPLKMKRSISDDSVEQIDDVTEKLKGQMQDLIEEMSDRSSIDSGADLEFVDKLEIDDAMESSNQERLYAPYRFLLKRLYMRSRIGGDKVQQGQDKKLKFDAKQEEQYDDVLEEPREEEEQSSKEQQPEDFLNQLGIGVVCKKGNKKEGPHMNDYMIYSDPYSKVYIVCNGHGEFGHYLSNLAYRMVFHHLIHSPQFYTQPESALRSVLKKLQQRFITYIETKKLQDSYNALLSGCVITVIIQRAHKVYLGHIGNNKVLVNKEHIYKDKQKKNLVELVPLHTPDDNEEQNRIFNHGGEVRHINGDDYVFVRGRLYPNLHVSRSIGDIIGHIIGINSEPMIRSYDITLQDRFLLCGTYSVFQYLEDEEVLNHLIGFTLMNIRQACETLYKQAKSSWIINEGFFEDMTLLMIWLGPTKDEK